MEQVGEKKQTNNEVNDVTNESVDNVNKKKSIMEVVGILKVDEDFKKFSIDEARKIAQKDVASRVMKSLENK